MFLKNANLTEEEKVSFLALVRKMIVADGVTNDAENDLLKSFANELDISTNMEEKCMQDPATLLSKISNVKKRSIYIELMSLALIDGNYDDKEKKELLEIQHSFGLPSDFVRDAEVWLVNYMEQVKSGFKLVGETIK
jgi:uncharacterized tellurite resistance protein B-like protein